MRKALILDPFSGISGDMFLSALVDLGVPFETLRDTLLAIPELAKVTAEKETVRRGPFEATHIDVRCPEEHAHRTLSSIRHVIESANLKDTVKQGAIKTFTLLAAAEAKVHGREIDEVHFHEVGALDAIFDIVGAHVGLDLLGATERFTRPIVLGSGSTRSEHGEIPVPAPATLELLSGYSVSFSEQPHELATPTGAAIIASAFTPLAASTRVIPDRIGYGAGTRDPDGMPNVLRAILGSVEEAARHVCIITSTIDDMNPEMYGFLMEKLLARGVLEVYYNPIMMKKNRPGLELTVITEESDVYETCDFLLSNTTTLGMRVHREERLEIPRRRETVETAYGAVDVKVASRPGGTETMSPEYESCKAAAERSKVSLLAVYDAVRKAWNDEQGQKS